MLGRRGGFGHASVKKVNTVNLPVIPRIYWPVISTIKRVCVQLGWVWSMVTLLTL